MGVWNAHHFKAHTYHNRVLPSRAGVTKAILFLFRGLWVQASIATAGGGTLKASAPLAHPKPFMLRTIQRQKRCLRFRFRVARFWVVGSRIQGSVFRDQGLKV